ncbi:unnamed protein product [Caenorhabditis angaria]|uniref:Uncharacterized protein n=1 Tax=Caenorhabditis angaria TaxID=860376 RepID=A0A9P1ILS9_9PELO|nr:unnamed protein product [Caenorhabditis angaria]
MPKKMIEQEDQKIVLPNNNVDKKPDKFLHESASPSNIDETLDDEEDDDSITNPDQTSAEKMEDQRFLYLQHQISKIMRHLHVEPCSCQNCLNIQKMQQKMNTPQSDPAAMLAQLFPNASHQQIQTLLELSKLNQLPTHVADATQSNGSGYVATGEQSNGGGKIMHHQNLHQNGGSKIGSGPYGMNSATASPGPSSDGGSDENELAQLQQPRQNLHQNLNTVPQQQQHQPPASHQNNPNVFAQSMVDMIKMNAAQSASSPGFLRGRGRGRPKLIGDELDADLVDHMVNIKQNEFHNHLTASQALHLAKKYILERAPGLLEEHGGHVKLKLTWAMKLVSRIAERQKEIEYGLPPGTLSNMGRTLGNLPGNNFMADVVAQNLLSQHMMMMSGGGGTGNGGGPTGNHYENRQPISKDQMMMGNNGGAHNMSGGAAQQTEFFMCEF